MLKASALYIVVVVSLLIAMISASLLTIAFYYRMEAQKKIRADRLHLNVESGIALLLSQGYNQSKNQQMFDLFGQEKDSLILQKQQWGVFDVNTVLAFTQRDTLKRAFFSGCTFDDLNAIYLADEDRPLSVSGATQIVGDGQFPKSGLKQAYVDGKAYAGGKELIKGAIKESGRDLPALDQAMIKSIVGRLKTNEGVNFDVRDSLHQIGRAHV